MVQEHRNLTQEARTGRRAHGFLQPPPVRNGLAQHSRQRHQEAPLVGCESDVPFPGYREKPLHPAFDFDQGRRAPHETSIAERAGRDRARAGPIESVADEALAAGPELGNAKRALALQFFFGADALGLLRDPAEVARLFGRLEQAHVLELDALMQQREDLVEDPADRLARVQQE